MFFDKGFDLLRILLVGVLIYTGLVAFLRISGKRTLAKMNAFDFVVTVALGSTLASALLSSDVSLAEGALALGLLVALQFTVAWVLVRVPALRGLFRSEPTMLLRDGQFLPRALTRERVTEDEVRQAVRSQGSGDLEDVAAVVLETDGTFSVISRAKVGSGGALLDVTAAE